jgi:hypothetical protein
MKYNLRHWVASNPSKERLGGEKHQALVSRSVTDINIVNIQYISKMIFLEMYFHKTTVISPGQAERS